MRSRLPPPAEAIRIDGELSERSWTEAASYRESFNSANRRKARPPRIRPTSGCCSIATRSTSPFAPRQRNRHRIVGLLTRRDDFSPSDWISILIDSYHDHRTAFEFGINPAGVKFDRYWFNDNNNDRGWDAVWDAAVLRTPDGWQAEFRIPFSQLRFKVTSPDAIGFAVTRTVARANETSTWPLLAEKRERLRVVVRRAARPPHRRQRSPAGAHAVRGRPSGHRAGGQRQSAREVARSRHDASASISSTASPAA